MSDHMGNQQLRNCDHSHYMRANIARLMTTLKNEHTVWLGRPTSQCHLKHLERDGSTTYDAYLAAKAAKVCLVFSAHFAAIDSSLSTTTSSVACTLHLMHRIYTYMTHRPRENNKLNGPQQSGQSTAHLWQSPAFMLTNSLSLSLVALCCEVQLWLNEDGYTALPNITKFV